MPDVIDEAGSMGDQVAQGDRPPRRAELGLTGGVEAFEHLRRGELGQHTGDRFVEREPALLDQLHRCR
jgi:hypothetical protein